MSCITSTNLTVLWNEEKVESFKPERGLRQGDPLSPYLFVLCMEVLGHAIHGAVWDGTWKGVMAARGAPKVSHLFFADDLLLFGEATVRQATNIGRVLQDFLHSN